MSKTFLFTFLAILFCQLGLSQSNASNTPEKYRSFTLGFGPRTLNTTPGTILTSYVDDSPSMDNLSTTTMVEDKYNRLGAFLAFNFGKFKGLSHSVAFDISLGEHQGGLFYYSLGYSFPMDVGENSIVVRPAMNVGFANYGFDVGELDNNASYIQIGETQYFDSKLELHLKSQTFVYGPSVDFHFILPNRLKIFANVAYDIASANSNPTLEFAPPSSSDNDNSSSLEIDGNNPLVTYNGSKITSLPYEASGMRFTLGVGYAWTKN